MLATLQPFDPGQMLSAPDERLPAGVYLLRLRVGAFDQTRRVILLDH